LIPAITPSPPAVEDAAARDSGLADGDTLGECSAPLTDGWIERITDVDMCGLPDVFTGSRRQRRSGDLAQQLLDSPVDLVDDGPHLFYG
jgi:hypothetical protein